MSNRYLSNSALLVIDIQNDFCHSKGSLAQFGRDVSKNQEVVPKIKTLIKHARKVEVPIIFVQTVQDEFRNSDVWRDRPSVDPEVEIPVAQKGTWGAEFYEIYPEEKDIIIEKTRYSAFIGTDLDLVLRSLNIKSLIVTGVATNVCVESTARDGFMRDYYVTLVEDCCASFFNDLHEATIKNMNIFFGKSMNKGEIIQNWNKKR